MNQGNTSNTGGRSKKTTVEADGSLDQSLSTIYSMSCIQTCNKSFMIVHSYQDIINLYSWTIFVSRYHLIYDISVLLQQSFNIMLLIMWLYSSLHLCGHRKKNSSIVGSCCSNYIIYQIILTYSRAVNTVTQTVTYCSFGSSRIRHDCCYDELHYSCMFPVTEHWNIAIWNEDISVTF